LDRLLGGGLVQLRVLLVEDSPTDALLVERALRKGGYDPALERVESEPALVAALTRATWDVVLCDYMMPGWRGTDALQIVREMAPDLPFILVSGTIGEDIAVQAMQSGANDYLMKDRLTRLPAAVARALEEAELRRDYGRSRVALAFLAQASVQLAASLDATAIAETLVALAVPLVADAAAVDLVDDAGRLTRTASNEAGLDLPREGDAAVVAREAVDGLVPALCKDEASGRSFVALPLAMHGVALGSLTLAVHEPERVFSMVDGSVGVELAQRASLALENARLYQQARAAIVARDEFLQLAAHELKTPLTPLSTQVQAMVRHARTSDRAAPTARLEADLEATGRHVQRLTRLVDQLLDVSQLGTGPLQLTYTTVDLAHLAREVATEFAAQAAEAGCELRVDAPTQVRGAWDRARLGQVLGNLLGNAIKFGAGKPIAVRVAGDGMTARLAVSDHGRGVDPRDRMRIFERFERAVSLRHYGGFGVGLWVAREIVAAHGGVIAVHSEPGAGATFSVALPIARIDADVAAV
jgi:signal transduction histidine kinase